MRIGGRTRVSDPPAIITSHPRRTRGAHPGRTRSPRPGGTTTNTTETAIALSTAGASACDAARALLTGTGLLAILQQYTEPLDPEAPVIGVPDVEVIASALERSAHAALAAADRAVAIAGAAELGDEIDETALADAVNAASSAADAAQRCLRALGTCVLGATSQQETSDGVHLHEHAASVAIVEAAEDIRLGEDAWPALAATRAELVTEVAAVCCRLLLEEADDEHTLVSWELPNGSFVTLAGDTRGICTLAEDVERTDELDAGTAAVLTHLGWPEGSFGGPKISACTEWYVEDEGVVVSEIARLVVGTLIEVLGATDVGELTRTRTLASADTL